MDLSNYIHKPQKKSIIDEFNNEKELIVFQFNRATNSYKWLTIVKEDKQDDDHYSTLKFFPILLMNELVSIIYDELSFNEYKRNAEDIFNELIKHNRN